MVQFSRRYAERQANMFVVCATTPAQVFHALRRQMNRCARAFTGAPSQISPAWDIALPDPHQSLIKPHLQRLWPCLLAQQLQE